MSLTAFRPIAREQNYLMDHKQYYNIANKFVLLNSIARACFIFLLCTLRTSANKSREKKIFHRVENVIKQLVHTSAVRSSRYEARGNFGEHERCVRVARGVAKYVKIIIKYVPLVCTTLPATVMYITIQRYTTIRTPK